MDADYLAKFKKNPTAVLNGALLPPPVPGETNAQRNRVPRGVGGGKGQRARYLSPEAMEFVIDEYFMRCEAMETPPTLADLTLALGFSTKLTLKGYKDRSDDFRHVIETAETRMEGWKNRLLLKGGPTTQAAIFDLKNNHHWADKTESTVTHTPGGSLAELVQSLQGKVLRPVLTQPEEEVIEAEFSETKAPEPETEEVKELAQQKANAVKDWKTEVREMMRREYEEQKLLEDLNVSDLL